MEHEGAAGRQPEAPFYDNEQFGSPEASKEFLEKFYSELEGLKRILPKPAHFEHEQRVGDIEVADMEYLTFLAPLDPRDESSISLYKEGSDEHRKQHLIATIEFAPHHQERRRIAFDIAPDTITRREYEAFDHAEIEPTDDIEEWKERVAPHIAEYAVRMEEAHNLRKLSGMDFVSEGVAEKLLHIVEEYAKRLQSGRHSSETNTNR